MGQYSSLNLLLTSIIVFHPAHYNGCKTRTKRHETDTQSKLTFKRLAPTTTEGEVENLTDQTPRKKHKAAGDSDVDNSDRETE